MRLFSKLFSLIAKICQNSYILFLLKEILCGFVSKACLCVHSHDGFPHMLESLLHKLPHTVHLSCADDEILWLLLLQHHPHRLENRDG